MSIDDDSNLRTWQSNPNIAAAGGTAVQKNKHRSDASGLDYTVTAREEGSRNAVTAGAAAGLTQPHWVLTLAPVRSHCFSARSWAAN